MIAAPRTGTNIRTAMAVTMPRADIFAFVDGAGAEVASVGAAFEVYARPCGAPLGQGGVPAGKYENGLGTLIRVGVPHVVQ